MIGIFKIKRVNFIVFGCSVIAVSTSVFSEIFMDKIPCQLCSISRLLYVFIAVSSCVSLISKAPFTKWAVFFLIGVSTCFSFYHLGVENHWWAAPHSCVSKLPSLNDVARSVQANVPYCDKVNLEILGLSSTLWNFLLSSFLFWITSLSMAFGMLRKEK